MNPCTVMSVSRTFLPLTRSSLTVCEPSAGAGGSVEVRHRGKVDLDVALLHLGLGALELVLVAACARDERRDQPRRCDSADPQDVRHGAVLTWCNRAPQVGVIAALALFACDSPARVKPWRHAPDPTAEAANAPALAGPVRGRRATADVHAARGHTLRIHIDAEPGRLTPDPRAVAVGPPDHARNRVRAAAALRAARRDRARPLRAAARAQLAGDARRASRSASSSSPA